MLILSVTRKNTENIIKIGLKSFTLKDLDINLKVI